MSGGAPGRRDDQSAHAAGKPGSGTPSVASGATPATTGGTELAVGFYADSGFGDSLTAASGFAPRVNISRVGDMELLAEDQVVGAGATPNASVITGASTYWLMSTLVFKNATTGQIAQIVRGLKAAGHSTLTAALPAASIAPASTTVATVRHAAGPLRPGDGGEPPGVRVTAPRRRGGEA